MLGPHLILDLYGCTQEKLGEEETIYKILYELPELIGMRRITEPHIYKIPPNPETFDKGGISGYIVIAESHISIHTFIEQGFASIDIFSCREFDIDKAVNYIKNILKPRKIDKKVIIRGREFIKQLG